MQVKSTDSRSDLNSRHINILTPRFSVLIRICVLHGEPNICIRLPGGFLVNEALREDVLQGLALSFGQVRSYAPPLPPHPPE